MKLKHQAISAVSATALLLGASVGLVTIGGTTATQAEPIDPAAVAALQAAVNNPNSDLAALINQMNSEVPGSGTQFAQAFSNTDTDALANALATLAAGNVALQNTIDSALTTLSQEPGLASVTTSGGTNINVANVVSTIETTVQNQFAGNNNGSGSNGNSQNNSNDQQNNLTDNLQNNLQNLNPGASPNNQNNGFNGSTINNPFTRGNPNSNAGLSNTNNNSGNTGQPNNSGQPNSRA